MVGEAGQEGGEVRSGQQRPQSVPASVTRAEVGHQLQQLVPGQRPGKHHRVLGSFQVVVDVYISRLQFLINMLELAMMIVDIRNYFLRLAWQPADEFSFLVDLFLNTLKLEPSSKRVFGQSRHCFAACRELPDLHGILLHDRQQLKIIVE